MTNTTWGGEVTALIPQRYRVEKVRSVAQIVRYPDSPFILHQPFPPAGDQPSAIEALSGPQDEAEQMRKVFEQRRDLIVRRINAMPGVSCLKPSGAFYVMMNLEQILGKQIDGQVIGSGDDFAKLLLEKSLVAVVPGSGFGAPNFVRLSYAISTENIETGMDRLEGFLKQLQ